ncbi:FAD-dependent oxidoreductase [Photorhabdus heterorhabditis]|uniref:D-amino-acid oxidase n=1 Tax=Photorhabdus heterorhabditis TaxID=880156 RepID=A0ABR5K7D5_9GAMM|nr:FAD-dependent oxidoreductase [Photorhabdus heterorhabditis]KOY60397.1 thiamine biosynthesis protein thio [Photorhabdus heterorhabditis]MBS9441705.1 FAD-dependent oxidoreductase [Photorhabdus heterorhabditis]
MHITIIGAGVAGLTCAAEFVARGGNVRILERGSKIGAKACSWWAGGMLAPWCEGESAEPSVVNLGQRAIDWWANHTDTLTSLGTLVLALGRDISELKTFANKTENYENVDSDQIAELEPDLADRFHKGLFFKDEAFLNPRKAITQLSEKLERLGVEFVFNNEANVSEVRGTDLVVDCRGLEARDISKTLRGVKGEMLLIHSNDIKINRSIRLLHPRIPLYLVPRGNGDYMVGATMIENEERERISARSIFELLGSTLALHPSFNEAEIVEIGVDARPTFPDNLPRVYWKGEILCVNGLYRHGFLLSPSMAQMAAKAVFEGSNIPESIDEYSR